ncbi:hypothetical protein BaRGS_00025857 [Batillaria attramentaria]|uniref:Uncharacterized protein n=1 Tax=Batillaria attramentaria TaxID=370345 RepID=A0ABD0K7M3_9CAEN
MDRLFCCQGQVFQCFVVVRPCITCSVVMMLLWSVEDGQFKKMIKKKEACLILEFYLCSVCHEVKYEMLWTSISQESVRGAESVSCDILTAVDID